MIKSYVKIKPNWWKFIPWVSKYTANAIYPNIYLPKDVYQNLSSDNPNTKYVSVLIHEETHLKREIEMGWLKFGLKYALFPKFRFKEELIAIKSAMKYLKIKGLTFDTARHAKFLSGWLYLWPVSYETAKKALDKAWEEAPSVLRTNETSNPF